MHLPRKKFQRPPGKSARQSQRFFSLFLSRCQPYSLAPQSDPSSPDVLESSSAALIERAPEVSEIQAGAVAADLLVQPEAQQQPEPEPIPLALSPIVDLIHKRLKATSKKIVCSSAVLSSYYSYGLPRTQKSRISIYATTDPEKLNEDQKATLKTLPGLEAVQKELTEVKKAIEVRLLPRRVRNSPLTVQSGS